MTDSRGGDNDAVVGDGAAADGEHVHARNGHRAHRGTRTRTKTAAASRHSTMTYTNIYSHYKYLTFVCINYIHT